MARIAKAILGGIDLEDKNNIYATVAAPTAYHLNESAYSTPITLETGGVECEEIGPRKWQVKGRAAGSAHGSIKIPSDLGDGNMVVRIKENAFAGDQYLSSITIPNTVIEIGSSAFANCKLLTSATFVDDDNVPIFFKKGNWTGTPKMCCQWRSPDSATLLSRDSKDEDMELFDATDGIYYHWIPTNATYVNVYFKCEEDDKVLQTQSNTFEGEAIDALANCLFYTEGSTWTEGEIINYNCKCDYRYNPGTDFLEGNGLKINNTAFYGSTIQSLTLPKRTVVIEHNAFENCQSLTKVEIPVRNRLLAIKGGTFASCGALTAVNLAHGIKEIGDAAFLDCDSLTTIQFPASLERIGTSAFCDCINLSWIWFATTGTRKPNIESIGEAAFARCGAIGSMEFGKLVLPDSLKYIGANAFAEIYEGKEEYARGVHFNNSYTWFVSNNANPEAMTNVTRTVFEPLHLMSGNTNIGYVEPREEENRAKLMVHYVASHWHRLDKMLPPTLEYDTTKNEIKITDHLGVAEEYYLYVNPKPGEPNRYKIEPVSITNE